MHILPFKPLIVNVKHLLYFWFSSQGDYGILKYQDTSTGKPVAELFTKLGKCDCMTQNPYNAVIHLGHYNGKDILLFNTGLKVLFFQSVFFI